MEKKKYSEKLKDPRWQKMRLQILERDGWCCQRCLDSESTLHVHHLRYVPDWEPWEYPPNLCLTLCEECHNIEYEMMPDAISNLIEQIKDKGFLSNSIRELASAFNGLDVVCAPEVTASIIEYVFRDGELFAELKDRYFEHLAKEIEKRKGCLK